MRRSRALAAVATSLAGTVALTVGVVDPVGASGYGRGSARVLLEDLSSPKGLSLDPLGNPVIGQGAFGPPGPVLWYLQSGRKSFTLPVTEPLNVVDVAISPLDGSGWAIVPGPDADPSDEIPPEGFLYHRLLDGTTVEVLNITAYQVGDPDPYNTNGAPDESNPYGLAVLPNGDALVADAAGNDVIRVTPDGVATTVALFDAELVSTDHLPPEQGLPPELPAESVPTSIAVGRNGEIYVGELKGFPFRPGSSKVWRVDLDDDEAAVCTVNGPADDCEIYAEGLTAIQDIALGRGGRLYVYELAAEGTLAFEAGFETGEFPPAVLLEVRGRRQRELAAGELSQPGGVVVTQSGRIYVTDGVFTGGRLLRINT